MKSSDNGRQKKAASGNKQKIVLGALVGVLGVVLFAQFGAGGDGDSGGTAAASSGTDDTVALAQTNDASQPPRDIVPGNAVLADTESGGGLSTNPFKHFLESFVEPEPEEEPEIEELPRPSVKLTGTMPGSNPIAMIDQRIYRVGDVVQGWTIKKIEARSVLLMSPSNSSFTLSMPVLGDG